MRGNNIKFILILAMAYFGLKWRQITVLEVITTSLLFSITYVTFTFFTKNKAKLYYQQNSKNQKIIENCPTIKSQRYQPPFLFQQSFIQLLAFQIFVGLKKNLKFHKEKVIDPQGQIEGTSISWPEDLSKREIKRQDVLFFVLPGLTGGDTDSYIHQLVDHIFSQGYRSVVYNYRLLSPELSFQKTKDHINLITDLRMTIEYIKKQYPEYKHIVAIGHSYGANQIVNYLGKYSSDPIIKAAASVANPFCMNVSSKFIVGTIYDWFLARLLANKLKSVQHTFDLAPKEWGINMEKALNATTLYEFDNNITIKFYGYPTVDTYYRKFGCINEILNVSVPLFCLSASDDDIAHQKALPRDEALVNPNIILMETDKGSHVVWLEGNNPFKMKCWYPKPVLEFMNQIISELK
ncbi:hypothetical protein ABPG74_002252 [Tetrahymena malaccensis]